ncbi:MAG TPA: TonB-dependent receptor [Candidatus Acidoferrum sp.]|nr:TonB-dependent receptor [Candidatus Acidoferrum sp.]
MLCAQTSVHANGINGNGTGATSMAMGGTDVAWAKSPLEAMGDNPAGLGFLDTSEFDIGGVGGSVNGTFNKPSANSSGNLDETPEALPEGALGMRLGNSPFYGGISFIPTSMLYADWHYPDPPSSAGSYGYQEDKSEILVLRSAAGLAMQLTPQLSVGVSVGAVYNKNELVTPYIFQNVSGAAAGLDGAKTLLNLDTSGFGANGQIGILYRPLTNLQFGLSYQTKYKVDTSGDATGGYSLTGGSPPYAGFHYNAEVDNTFPDEVELGGSWKFLPKWRLAAEVDWIDWKNSFSALPVKLSNGSGPLVTTLGPNFQNYSDTIPLDWRSEFVYRVGLEYALTDNLFLRGGYCYGNSPVPSTTLNPMTAAIMQNTITCGIGYRWRACEFDLAYQCDLPVNHHVGTSGLLDGEYSNSSTEVQVNWLALTMGVHF